MLFRSSPAQPAVVSFTFGAAEDGVFQCVVAGVSPGTVTVTFAPVDPADGSHWIDNSSFTTGDDMAAALAAYMTQVAVGGTITITSLGTGAAESLDCSILSGLASVTGLPAFDVGADAYTPMWIDNSTFTTGTEMAAALDAVLGSEASHVGGVFTLTTTETGAAQHITFSGSGFASVTGLPAAGDGQDAIGFVIGDASGSPSAFGASAAADFAAHKRLRIPNDPSTEITEAVKL